MPTDTMTENETVQTFEVRREILIAASPEVAFEAMLEELGPGSVMPDGKSLSMKIEPWVGGRWFRDLGETGGYKYGHLWGHVQVIKAPTLLELTGPMPMSFPAINHVQFRLKAEGNGTRLSFVHRSMGLMPPDFKLGMPEGWKMWLSRIQEGAERKAKGQKGGAR
jgi:uncharacterized protein YndB with AHSA1/START domain